MKVSNSAMGFTRRKLIVSLFGKLMLKMKELTDFFLRPAIDFTLPVNPSFSVFRDQNSNLDVLVV